MGKLSIANSYILYPTPDGNTINEVETDPGTTAARVLTRER